MPLIDERFVPAFLMLFGNARRQLIVLVCGVTIGGCAERILGGWRDQ